MRCCLRSAAVANLRLHVSSRHWNTWRQKRDLGRCDSTGFEKELRDGGLLGQFYTLQNKSADISTYLELAGRLSSEKGIMSLHDMQVQQVRARQYRAAHAAAQRLATVSLELLRLAVQRLSSHLPAAISSFCSHRFVPMSLHKAMTHASGNSASDMCIDSCRHRSMKNLCIRVLRRKHLQRRGLQRALHVVPHKQWGARGQPAPVAHEPSVLLVCSLLCVMVLARCWADGCMRHCALAAHVAACLKGIVLTAPVQCELLARGSVYCSCWRRSVRRCAC